MREGMKEMKEAMMKEMKAEMKEMKDGMVNQIVGRLSAVLREESERQKKARQEDVERRQEQDAKRKQVADDEERQKKKQLDEQWQKEEEEKRKDVEATERRRKKKHQEEERRQKEVEAGMKEVMEAVKEMKTGMKGWKEGMLKKRARLASYAEQQRQPEAKAKAMAEETERLAREMEEEDLTMQGEGTWKGVEEEIAEGLGSLLLIESGEANVAEGVVIVPGQNVEVSRRRPRQEDREPEGHAAKRRRAAGIQELIPIIPGEKKGMKIDKCDNRKNAVVDDKVCWKFYFPDIDMQAYGMNPNRINKWLEDLDFTTWLPTGVWSAIIERHLDKPDGLHDPHAFIPPDIPSLTAHSPFRFPSPLRAPVRYRSPLLLCASKCITADSQRFRSAHPAAILRESLRTLSQSQSRNKMLRPGFVAAGAAGAAWASDPAEWRNATAETAEGAAGGTTMGRGALQDAWTYDVASNERWLSQEKARLLTMVQVGSEGGRGTREWDEEGWEWEQGDEMRKRRWEMKGAWKA
ncbi:unnamed protein product [Closterium sp. NIES-64]|nr:unnamed protein product [Closterium sp. NIES-64]